MDVTATNFREVLPKVFDAINKADFVAVDAEFSGLRRSTADQEFSIMDTLEERYTKVASSVKEFGMIQFGMSCFHSDANKKSYETATFSFYLLKKMTSLFSPNTFTVCSNSLRFLAANKFDFNKLFSDGLPYLNQVEAHHNRSRLPDQITKRLGITSEKPSVQDPISSLFKVIKDYVATESAKLLRQANNASPSTTSKTEGPSSPKDERNGISNGLILDSKFKAEDILEVPVDQLHSPANYTPPFHSLRKFCLKEVKRSFWKLLRLLVACECSNVDATLDYDEQALFVRVFLNTEDRDKFVYYDEVDKFYNTIGFSHIVFHLLKTGKPIVGHNCILDVMHLVDKCLQPVPLDLNSFKELYKANFTLLYDTKLLTVGAPFAHQMENTSLERVYKFASSSCPKLTTLKGCRSYNLKSQEGTKEHDAGFDAFMTAVAFVGVVRKLGGPRKREKSLLDSPHLKNVANRTYLMQICDMNALHLAGDDGVVDRTGVFVVTSSFELRFSQVKTFFPDLASPTIVSDHTPDHRHFVLPSTDAERKKAPVLLRKALTLCPSSVHIILYSSNLNSPESMDTSDSTSGEACCYSVQNKAIPPPLPSHSSPDVNNSDVGDVHLSVPLTPRTAHLARNSKLNAKSPEFTPASTSGKSRRSSGNPKSNQQTRPTLTGYRTLEEFNATNQTVMEDLGVELRREDKTSIIDSGAGTIHLKRGEKRKSGQQFEEVEMTEVEEQAPLISNNSKNDSEEWKTVRNRNRNHKWGGSAASCNVANRFQPDDQEPEKIEVKEEAPIRRLRKRSCTGDVRAHNRGGAGHSLTARDDVAHSVNVNDDMSNVVAEGENDGAEATAEGKELKRLKSVGSVMALILQLTDCVIL
ncbi:poly(A)-specific ribonuclease PARN-like isoform X2 [Hyalella azteca]|uniref:Poly(A)-specific ribonuclease PARN-like isoform X2 n=1 Tax=Hyalella azteca TaxID=294128 RepID=A0A979FXQ7_HYAAZ|nr:poly(A)-specific ribonuclease PARN-like isoform X2 [Hyalella azteca]